MKKEKVKYFCKKCDEHIPLKQTQLTGPNKDYAMLTLNCDHKLLQKL